MPLGIAGQPTFGPPNNFNWNGIPRSYEVNQRRGPRFQGKRHHEQARDRPKSKHALPGQEPWLLIRTKLGKRFVHNPETRVSFWKAPSHLQAVIEEVEAQIEKQKGGASTEKIVLQKSEHAPNEAPTEEARLSPEQPASRAKTGEVDEKEEEDQGVNSDDLEEIEVTDSEDDENPSKRQRFDVGAANAAREFNEDDIAYQLAAMEQEYGADEVEYGEGKDENWQEEVEGAPLAEEDSMGLFKDMLDDYGLNPYSTWDKIVQEGKIVEDERYILLPNMKSRKEAWAEWSREKIQILKEQRAKDVTKNVRIN